MLLAFFIFIEAVMNIAHGNFTVEYKDNIIYVVLEGAFNEYSVANWANEIKSIINSLNGDRFSILMDMNLADGGTPESFKVSNQYNAWLNEQNMVAKALIYGSSVLEDMDNTLVASKKNQNTKVFNNVELAESWLQEQFLL